MMAMLALGALALVHVAAAAPAAAPALTGHLDASMRLPCPIQQPAAVEELLRSAAAAGCACSPKTLCEPVRTEHAKEVFGFTAGSTYASMDWEQVTTVAWSTDAPLVCLAHKHEARLIASAPLSNITILGTSATARKAWITKVVAMVKALNIDGVTFDYESPIPNGAPEAEMYVNIIKETTAALHSEVPGSQTSVCVAWSPNHIDGRYYDIMGFSKAADLLYIMMYDTRSQIFDVCLAGPNAGLPIAQLGAQQYLDVGVPAKQLVLGVPVRHAHTPTPTHTPLSSFCSLDLLSLADGLYTIDSTPVHVPSA
jgi:spore germination protein YaaH